MSRCALAAIIREEIKSLSRIVDALEDNSKLCFPDSYDCSRCIDETLKNLKRVKRLSRKIPFSDYERGVAVNIFRK
ncbi:MAG: hypothetical protein KJ893_08195 [Candidatus Omnitrophica bacterium]|nr:hypothetical protein [Candidatus Omnitrophota bacterium]